MSEKFHYDKLYSETETAFGKIDGPVKIVGDILKYRNSGTVLELGTGQGRNALFLAENGFEVTAQDLSSIGIEIIQKKAQERGLQIKTEVGDVRQLQLDRNFDVLVSTFMLHHLTRDEALKLIKTIQEHTSLDGLNVITAFTKNGDFYREDPAVETFYPDEGELRGLYKDWTILEYEELESKALKQRPDGNQMTNISSRLLARKIK